MSPPRAAQERMKKKNCSTPCYLCALPPSSPLSQQAQATSDGVHPALLCWANGGHCDSARLHLCAPCIPAQRHASNASSPGCCCCSPQALLPLFPPQQHNLLPCALPGTQGLQLGSWGCQGGPVGAQDLGVREGEGR